MIPTPQPRGNKDEIIKLEKLAEVLNLTLVDSNCIGNDAIDIRTSSINFEEFDRHLTDNHFINKVELNDKSRYEKLEQVYRSLKGLCKRSKKLCPGGIVDFLVDKKLNPVLRKTFYFLLNHEGWEYK